MIRTKVRDDGKTVRLLDRKTNQLMVTETRHPAPFRALPRPVRDRIVGNPAKGVVGLETSKKFLVRYQDLTNQYVTAVRCWKCGQRICAYQPVLRKVEGNDPHAGEVTVMATLNGRQMVVGAMLPYNHYREGLFAYRTAQKVLATFSYLHCADCSIKDEHGEDLLACLLGQFDHRRDVLKPYLEVVDDDAWAQYMFGWSGIQLVGKTGPSIGPKELMEQAMKKGKG